MALPTVQAVLDREPPPTATWQALAPSDGETKRAHAAFVDYALMGPGRSLRKLCERYRGQTESGSGVEKPPTRRLSSLEEWSAKHAWQKRIGAWETEQRLQEQEVWEVRRKAVREADWETGEALRGLADDILAQAPQFLKTTRRLVKGAKGQPAKEIITLGIDIPAMIKALEVASRLQGQAAGVELPAQRVNVIYDASADEWADAFKQAQAELDKWKQEHGTSSSDGNPTDTPG